MGYNRSFLPTKKLSPLQYRKINPNVNRSDTLGIIVVTSTTSAETKVGMKDGWLCEWLDDLFLLLQLQLCCVLLVVIVAVGVYVVIVCYV
jgi:hypothetical protein